MPTGAVDCPGDRDLSVAFVLPATVPPMFTAARPIGREWHDTGGGVEGSEILLLLRRLLI
jgi:hypothetical protein